jgi:hypothetical protein
MKTALRIGTLALTFLALAAMAHAGILFGVPLNFVMQGDDNSKTFRFNLGNIVATNQSGYTLVDPSASPVSVHVTGCQVSGAPILGPLAIVDQNGNLVVSNPNGTLPVNTYALPAGFSGKPPKSLPANAQQNSSFWNIQLNSDGVTLQWVYAQYLLTYAPTAAINGNQVTVTFPQALPSTMFSGDPSNPSMPMACPVNLTVLYAGN